MCAGSWLLILFTLTCLFLARQACCISLCIAVLLPTKGATSALTCCWADQSSTSCERKSSMLPPLSPSPSFHAVFAPCPLMATYMLMQALIISDHCCLLNTAGQPQQLLPWCICSCCCCCCWSGQACRAHHGNLCRAGGSGVC